MRKLITTLAVSLATVTGLAAATAPSQAKAAAAASCSAWTVPSLNQVRQNNGYSFWLSYANGTWRVANRPDAEVKFTSRTARAYNFVITWENGTSGVYLGSIDRYGFISGTTYDRFKPSSRATFNMRKTATCR